MIGYKVKATAKTPPHTANYSGWGSPTVENAAKKTLAKKVLKAVMKPLAGGPVLTVADIVSKPAQAVAAGVMAVIEHKFEKAALYGQGYKGLAAADIDVTLSGDFQGAYRLKGRGDLDKLPTLLSLIPQRNTTSKFMEESVVKDVFIAHVAFARRLRAAARENLSEELKGRQPKVYQLSIKIQV